MKPQAVIVNTVREQIIDVEALYNALKAKRLRGAGLGVFEAEPLPGSS